MDRSAGLHPNKIMPNDMQAGRQRERNRISDESGHRNNPARYAQIHRASIWRMPRSASRTWTEVEDRPV